MPHLPRRYIESFKKAWKEAYGQDLSDELADEGGWALLEVYGPIIERRAKEIMKERASTQPNLKKESPGPGESNNTTG